MEFLVFDVSGTTVKSAIMGADGTVFQEDKHPVPDGEMGTYEDFLQVLKDAYAHYEVPVDGIAASLPGRIDSQAGVVITPGALKYNRGRHLAEDIRARVADVPTVIVNDGKAAAAGEYWQGNLAGTTCGVVMLLGTGIAGGIVMDGKVWEGAGSFAGEFSYVYERPAMRSEKDHRWVDNASIPGLISYVSKRTGMRERLLDGKKVFQMIESGNDYALAGLRDMTDYIAYMIFDTACILDPEKVLLGGSIAREPLILELVQEELDRIYALVPDDLPHVQVDICAHPGEASLIGAEYVLLQRSSELASA